MDWFQKIHQKSTWHEKQEAFRHPENLLDLLLDVLVPSNLGDERTDLVLDLHQTTKSTLHDGGKVQQSQCVASWGSVKDHHGEVHPFH